VKTARRPAWWLLAAVLAAAPAAHADELFMARSAQAFPEAMLTLQEAIRARGYTVARVQRVDIGLTKSGFKTDKYRIVFLGRHEEVRDLVRRHPALAAYLPLKIAIFAEGSQTLVVTINPAVLAEFYPAPDLAPVFRRWAADLEAIFDRMRIRE